MHGILREESACEVEMFYKEDKVCKCMNVKTWIDAHYKDVESYVIVLRGAMRSSQPLVAIGAELWGLRARIIRRLGKMLM